MSALMVKRTWLGRFGIYVMISAPAARRARSARPVQIHGNWWSEAPRNRFSRKTFRLKLGRKAARGLGLGDSAAAIYSHSQERSDLFALGHALSLDRPAARSIRSNGLVSLRTGEILELFSVFIQNFGFSTVTKRFPPPWAVACTFECSAQYHFVEIR
jgi:hypothetical protein